MFTPCPNRGSHLRTAARRVAARLRWLAVALAAITCASLAVTVIVGLGLAGFGGNGALAHLLSRVHQGWWPGA